MSPAAEKRVCGMLGLCLRAGFLVSGTDSSVELIRSGKAALALLDEGVSENTRKRLTDSCRFYGVPLYEMSRGALGHAIGKENRQTAALSEGGLADRLLTVLENEIRLQADILLQVNAGVQATT